MSSGGSKVAKYARRLRDCLYTQSQTPSHTLELKAEAPFGVRERRVFTCSFACQDERDWVERIQISGFVFHVRFLQNTPWFIPRANPFIFGLKVECRTSNHEFSPGHLR